MPNTYFRFRQFTVHQDRTAMKVCTDACLFGAWVASETGNENFERVLDIGAGTGLLSLMIAQQTGAQIDAVEIEENAYAQASENFAASPWNDRLKVHYTSVQQFNPSYRYGLIISNPPFYENDLRSPDKQKNLAMHSTHLDVDGLFDAVKRLLAPGGKMAMLVPYLRVKAIEKKISESKLFIIKKVAVKQTENHTPFRCMYLLSNVFSALSERKITVNDEEFIMLLKNYYL